MENNQNRIDRFYRDALSDLRGSASPSARNRMKWWWFWFGIKNYLIGLAALFLIGASVYFGFFMSNHSADEHFETTELTVETVNHQEINQAATPGESKPMVDEAVTENLAIDNSIPATVITSNQVKTSIGGIITPKVEAGNDETELSTRQEKENGIDTFPLLETKKNNPQVFLSPEKKFSIDSATYPYHDIRKKSWISISLYAAPAYTASTLSADHAFDDYLNYRNNHETGTISWSAGADVQFNIKNWYIQTGLSYATFSDRRNGYQAIDSANSYYNNDTTWGWVYDPPDFGKPIVLSIDTSFVPVYANINEGVNQWKYLEIPLIVGYTFHFNRLSFDVGTGFSYSLLLGASGNVPSLTEEKLFTELSELEAQMNKHTFNYILQIGVAYHLSPQWSLIFKPYYKQNLQSVFEKNYPVDQRFKAFSIKFGLKVDL